MLKRCFKVVPELALRVFNWLKLKDGYSHTMQTYNTVLHIAGKAKEFGLVKKLVEEMSMESKMMLTHGPFL
ncbi:putative pentatricopeptide repeat-containing protein, mitochondrial [Glycine soja]|nr:putative pentatricopeptide repeat-containing protein, mitochondrial [Glycine max]